MKTYKSFAVLLCAALLSSCGEEKNRVSEILGPAPGARIKFFNFSLSAPTVNFYADDVKMTAVNPIVAGQESTSGVAYSQVGNGGLYSAIAVGQHTFSGRISATTDKNLPISNTVATLEDGKFYSYYLSGPYNTTTKTSDAFLLEDAFVPQLDYAVAYVRFVHVIHNANPMTLYAKNTTTGDSIAVGGTVAYKAAGAFTAVPNGVYDLTTRFTGSNTSVIARTGVSFSAGRIYTIGARGDITVVSTTATNRPILENNTNR